MHARTRRTTALVVALAAILSLAVLSPASGQTPDDLAGPDPSVPDPSVSDPSEPDPSVPDPPPIVDPPADPLARGQAAIDRLAERLPTVAAAYGIGPSDLRDLFETDGTLAVDPDDQLLYVDVLAPGEEPSVGPLDAPGAAPEPPTEEQVFQLASLPDAEKTIYLDFDGHTTTGTTWNSAYGVSTIVSPAYDTDGDAAAWSPDELQLILDSWAVVAEDYAPWNINVTTVEPPVDDLRYQGADDTRWGVRVVVTDDTFANCGCGGHAYVGAFDDPVDEPTFVYNTSFVGVSEAISHEVGHMLGLAHDGLTSGATYYAGHQGAGEPGWAPIMGVAYYQPVGQWSRQEYSGANNNGSAANYGQGPDDLAIISSLVNGNGFGLRPDDHGDAADPTPFNGGTPSVSGLIGTADDVDAFSFTTEGGLVSLDAVGDPTSPNLDIELTLLDDQGTVVATDNPVDGLSASLEATVEAGTWTVTVDGVGVGLPSADPPTGYTDHASIGQYLLTGILEGVAPADTEPPAVPTGLFATELDGTVVLVWDPNGEDDLAHYVIGRSATAGGPFTTLATVDGAVNGYTDPTPLAGDNHYVVAAEDTVGNRSADSAEVVVSVTPAATRVATGETLVYGSIVGDYTLTQAADGQSEVLTEDLSGGKPQNRHDRLDHRWTIPAAVGSQQLRVVATVDPDSGDADEGFAVEWSTDRVVWIPLTVIAPGDSIDDTFAIGGPTGDVHVRIIDTDRTPRQQSPDTVSVDLLQVTGDGRPVVDPEATEAIVELVVGTAPAGRGEEIGTATVTVVDDLGGPVSHAEVMITFDGDLFEQVIVTTDSSGTATAETAVSARKPVVTACVESVDAGDLSWRPGVEAC